MVSKYDCLKMLRNTIDASFATVDLNGNPQVRIIDIMHIDDNILYLIARGKIFIRKLH